MNKEDSEKKSIDRLNELEEDDKDYLGFVKMLDETSTHVKSKTKKEISNMGDLFVEEMEKRRKIEEKKKEIMIDYIVENSSQIILKDELLTYTYKDVFEIYSNLKRKNRPLLQKLKDLFIK